MRKVLTDIALVFSAGCFGGLLNSIVLWLAGGYGITATLGVALAPALTAAWLYPRLVWGGIWGLLFLLQAPRLRWWMRGLVFSLGPSALQLFVIFPEKTPHGMLGFGLGLATPVLVLAFNAVWGVATASALKAMGRA